MSGEETRVGSIERKEAIRVILLIHYYIFNRVESVGIGVAFERHGVDDGGADDFAAAPRTVDESEFRRAIDRSRNSLRVNMNARDCARRKRRACASRRREFAVQIRVGLVSAEATRSNLKSRTFDIKKIMVF